MYFMELISVVFVIDIAFVYDNFMDYSWYNCMGVEISLSNNKIYWKVQIFAKKW